MGLRDLFLRFKAFRSRRLQIGSGPSKKREPEIIKKPSWMVPFSHGYHIVEDPLFKGSDDSDYDSVVVQREQFEEIELWFFGVFDAQVGDAVTKYLQSHFFGRNLKVTEIRRKCEETMRKAYLGARAKVREALKEDTWEVGSASVTLINGEKLVIANMGEYRAVVCRDGVAHQIGTGHQHSTRRHWSRRLFSACELGNAIGGKHCKGSELLVGVENIDPDTEFVIIASNGIWEVMKNQEAVNLIRHLEDPKEASKYLAKEALCRLTKSNISCVVIRFD